MGIKTIPLSHLEADLRRTLDECADSGQALVVEMPDHRLLAIQALDAVEDDSLVDELIRSNPTFQSMLERSARGSRKPFAPRT